MRMDTATAALIGIVIPTLILLAVGAIVAVLVILLMFDLYGMWKYRRVTDCPEKKMLAEIRRERLKREAAKKLDKVYTGTKEVI